MKNVGLLYRYPTNSSTVTKGTLYLTATHLIFVDPSLKRETCILNSLISSVEKLPISAIGSPLLMRCKHFLCITFVIPSEKEAHDIYQSLIQLSQPSNNLKLLDFLRFNSTIFIYLLMQPISRIYIVFTILLPMSISLKIKVGISFLLKPSINEWVVLIICGY